MEITTTTTQTTSPANAPVPAQADTHAQTSTPAQANVRSFNPMFVFMGAGSVIYALFYTLLLYRNHSGITFPFFVGGTCFFFFCYLKRCGITSKKSWKYLILSLMLLGFSTCLTDSSVLIILNKLCVFFLFFYLFLHNLYEDDSWSPGKYFGAVISTTAACLPRLLRPFTDLRTFLRNRSKEASLRIIGEQEQAIVKGVLIALPLLAVIVSLLGSADAVFGELVQRVFSFDFNLHEDLRGIVSMLLFAFLASYTVMCSLSDRTVKEGKRDKKKDSPATAITFTAMICFVYALFCYIQIYYLFGGLGRLPEEYTYAEYAREGFFQLVFVCLLNLSLVLLCRSRYGEHKILNGTLTFISLCTYIMIASSVYRMLLYIDVYYLTFLRVFVLWALFVIFLLMSGALLLIYKISFPYTKYCLLVLVLCYLPFSLARPDYWIADYNLAHALTAEEADRLKSQNAYYDHEHFRDFAYLSQLSADAAPVIYRRAEELGYTEADWFLTYHRRILYTNYREAQIDTRFTYHLLYERSGDEFPGLEKTPVRKWNFSRQAAYQICNDFFTSSFQKSPSPDRNPAQYT